MAAKKNTVAKPVKLPAVTTKALAKAVIWETHKDVQPNAKGKDVLTGKSVKVGKGDLPTLNKAMNSEAFIEGFSEVFHAVGDGLRGKAVDTALKGIVPKGMKVVETSSKPLGFVVTIKSGAKYRFDVNRSTLGYRVAA